MRNKIILITGSTDGIGKQTAIDLAKKGAKIIIHGKNKELVENAVNELFKQENIKVFDSVVADFSSLSEVDKMANYIIENHEQLDILFNNAALYSEEKQLTEDNFELNFQVNYLASFLLTNKLIPLIKKSEDGRILNVTSMIHAAIIDFDNLQSEKSYNGNQALSLTKLCNILHTRKLNSELENTNIKANCLHPGVIATKLLNSAFKGGMPVSEGSRVMQYAAESPILKETGGMYLENNRPVQSSPVSYDVEIQNKLWDISLKMLDKYLG